METVSNVMRSEAQPKDIIASPINITNTVTRDSLTMLSTYVCTYIHIHIHFISPPGSHSSSLDMKTSHSTQSMIMYNYCLTVAKDVTWNHGNNITSSAFRMQETHSHSSTLKMEEAHSYEIMFIYLPMYIMSHIRKKAIFTVTAEFYSVWDN